MPGNFALGSAEPFCFFVSGVDRGNARGAERAVLQRRHARNGAAAGEQTSSLLLRCLPELSTISALPMSVRAA